MDRTEAFFIGLVTTGGSRETFLSRKYKKSVKPITVNLIVRARAKRGIPHQPESRTTLVKSAQCAAFQTESNEYKINRISADRRCHALENTDASLYDLDI
jgi:hypothetical protein